MIIHTSIGVVPTLLNFVGHCKTQRCINMSCSYQIDNSAGEKLYLQGKRSSAATGRKTTVQLYYDNNEKLVTDSDGITITGRMLGDVDRSASTTVTAGTYGSGSAIPVLTVDSNGFVDSAGSVSIDTSLVADTTPQLGGNLDLNGNNITGSGNINLTTGTMTLNTASTSALINLVGTGAGASAFSNYDIHEKLRKSC